jgi:hypothetical protein
VGAPVALDPHFADVLDEGLFDGDVVLRAPPYIIGIGLFEFKRPPPGIRAGNAAPGEHQVAEGQIVRAVPAWVGVEEDRPRHVVHAEFLNVYVRVILEAHPIIIGARSGGIEQGKGVGIHRVALSPNDDRLIRVAALAGRPPDLAGEVVAALD